MKKISVYLIPLLGMLALTTVHATSDSRVVVSGKFREAAEKYGIRINTLIAPLNYSYANSPIPLKELDGVRRWDQMGSEAQSFEKSVVKINNEADSALTEIIVSRILKESEENPKYFQALLGYHEVIPAAYGEFSARKSGEFDYVSVRGRFGQALNAVCLRSAPPENRNFLLLLPGRATTAEAIMGISTTQDYTNGIGKQFSNRLGINVCALGIFPHTDVPILRYGLSGRGVAIASVIDFLTAIKAELPQEAQTIILGGVSNGGHIAEYTAVVSSLVDAVLSSGAAARYDFSNSQYSLFRDEVKNYRHLDRTYATFDAVFRSGRIFKLIHPKPLIVSIGTHDAGHEVHGYPSKLEQLNTALEAYKDTNCLEVNLFVGKHAHDPDGETQALRSLLEKCLI